MSLSLIFIHQGYSDYLPFTLRQARATNPDTPIYLLGDADNDRFDFLNHIDVSTFSEAVTPFNRVYRHRSTNRQAFELACFQRWFLLRAFMEAAGLEAVLVLDSDVLLYTEAATLYNYHIAGHEFGLCIPDAQEPFRWSAFPHVLYWTRPVIQRFCDFLLDVYTDPKAFTPFQEKWNYHIKNGLSGGLCDMTALYRFAHAHGLSRTANFLNISHDTTIDLNLNKAENESPNAYEMAGPLKRLDWSEAPYPHGYHLRLKRPIAFLALHCQGAAKAYIPAFYRGPHFQGRKRLSLAVAMHYRLRPLATRLSVPLRRLLAYRRRA